MTRPTALAALSILFGLLSISTGTANAQNASQISVDKKHAWATLDPIEQYALIRNDGYRPFPTTTYIADALEDHLSALGRFGYAARCLDMEGAPQWGRAQEHRAARADAGHGGRPHDALPQSNGRL